MALEPPSRQRKACSSQIQPARHRAASGNCAGAFVRAGMGRVSLMMKRIVALARGSDGTEAARSGMPGRGGRWRCSAGGNGCAGFAIVVDAKTGKMLYSQAPDATRYPASLTKMMTLYLLFEALERGKTSLNAARSRFRPMLPPRRRPSSASSPARRSRVARRHPGDRDQVGQRHRRGHRRVPRRDENRPSPSR